MIPVALDYLGADFYGLWMTINAGMAMLIWLDLGIGNGLLTRLTVAVSKKNTGRARDLVRAAYSALGLVAVILLTAFLTVGQAIPWSTLLGVGNQLDNGMTTAIVGVCGLIFVLNLPLGLVQRVQYADRKIMENQIWVALGTILAVALVIAAVKFDWGPVAVIGFGSAGSLLGSLMASGWVFLLRRNPVRPSFGRVDPKLARDLFGLSGRFLVVGVASAVAMNIDPLIISHASTLAEVTGYSVPYKLFATCGVLITLINTPLWPTVGAALTKGDAAWVSVSCKRMTFVSAALILIVALGLVLGGDSVLNLLGAEDSSYSVVLLVGFGLWWLVIAGTSPMFMVQNAAGLLAPQTVGWLAFLLIAVPIKYLVVIAIGFQYLPLAGSVVYAMTVLPSAIWGYRSAIRSATAARGIVGSE